jgi:serine/threonine-protein kinase
MGEVVEAEHVALKKTVVVKVLLAELAAEEQVVDRMRLEAQALARLRSPHIVEVSHFAVTGDGRPFIVMERLIGRTLHDELKERRVMPWPEAVSWTIQMLDGLAVAHRAGLVHRDVKLANLFLCDAEEPGGSRTLKVLDFGVAKVVEAADGQGPAPLMFPTQDGVLVGTPRFISPEQVLAKKVDARADIYAAGLVLYSLAAGRGPFDEVRSFAELAKAHLEKPAPSLASVAPQEIPPALDEAVKRALAKSPGDRFATAEELASVLRRLLEDAGPDPWTKTETLGKGGGEASLSPAVVVASALVFAAVGAAAVLWLQR